MTAACEIIENGIGGGRVAADLEAEQGTPVELSIARVGDFKARVVWCADREVGFEFDDNPERLSEALVLLATYGTD